MGKCDLINFYPLPKPGRSGGDRAAVRVASGFVQGEDDFSYLGSKMHASAPMCIIPYGSHFILSEKVANDSKARKKRECSFTDTVGVGRTGTVRGAEDSAASVFSLPDFKDDVNVGPSEGVLRAGASTTAAEFGGQHPSGWTPTFTPVTDTPWVQQQSSGPVSARVVVKKLGKNKWSFEGTSTQDNEYNAEALLDLELTIPANRFATYSLKMDATVQTLSGLCALAASMGNGSNGADGNNYGNGVSASSPRLLTYSLTAESEAPLASLYFAVHASSGGQSASSCKATGTIELTIPEE